jgi:hypothetical protein
MNEFDAAAERWNAEHPLREQTHGTCPVCSGRDCFNVSRGAGGEARWTCFNARHNATGGGRQASDGEPRWFGDALDLEAHATGRTRAQILREAGYLSGDADPRPPRPAERPSEPPRPRPMEVPLPAPVAGLDGWRLYGTIIPSKNHRPIGEPLILGWRELLGWFDAPNGIPEPAAKYELRCWTAGVYAGGAHPHDTSKGAELAAASALVFDLDATDEPRPPKPTEDALLEHYCKRGERLPPERLLRLLSAVLPGVAWAAHPTVSSAPGLWRWRLLIPLAEPLPGGAYQAVVDALRLRFLASEAPRALEADARHNRKPTGLSFAPAVLPERRADYGALSAEGGLLAWREILDGAAKRANLSVAEDFPQLAEALKRRCEYEQRETVLKVMMHEEPLRRVEALGFVRPSRDWLAEPPPEREYLIHSAENGPGLFARGITGVLAAGGGSGKTFLLTALALAVVTRTPWLGRYPLGRRTIGRAVLILGEEPADEVRRRIYAQAQALGLERADLEGRLLVLPGAGTSELALTQAQDGGRPAHTRFADDLYAYLKAEAGPGWDVVIVDPLSHFAGPDVEKDAAAATRLLQVLTRFTTLPGGPAVLLAHHNRKPGKDEGSASASSAVVRGSSAIVDNARWVAQLERDTDPLPEGFEAYGLVRLRVTKSNYAPPPADGDKGMVLLRVAGGALRAPTPAELARIRLAKGDVPPAEQRRGSLTIAETLEEKLAKIETQKELDMITAGDDEVKKEKVLRIYATKRAAAEAEANRAKRSVSRREKR